MSRTFRKKDDSFKYKKQKTKKPWDDADQNFEGGEDKCKKERQLRELRRHKHDLESD